MADKKIDGLEVLHALITNIQRQLDRIPADLEERITTQRETVALALAAADKTTAIAQSTADKAMAKAEAAADKQYLESQIEGLRSATVSQIVAQKEAISAALTAAKEALTAAMSASEKAIAKAEEANEKRFSSVNEFRSTLADQQKTFVIKTEVDFKFVAFEKKLDEYSERLRTIDLKFGGYVTSQSHESTMAQWVEWRRAVDAQLTAAASKSSLIYAAIAVAIACGGLGIAIFNAITKRAL